MVASASFRFYAELNDFLAPARRGREFELAFQPGGTAQLKHMVEALGVPHTEIELLLVNGVSVGFDHRVSAGDRVAVYPVFEALDVTPLLRLRTQALRRTRFIADAHLGGLARLLRMTGFDTLYDNRFGDAEIARLAAAQGRVVLTRDRDLLMRRSVTHGCYLHGLRPRLQLRELFRRLDLAGSARPFTRCLACNRPLLPLDKSAVMTMKQLPAGVGARFERFSGCDGCGRVYWEGSHWRNMRFMLDGLLAES